jgi:hypothetical protein
VSTSSGEEANLRVQHLVNVPQVPQQQGFDVQTDKSLTVDPPVSEPFGPSAGEIKKPLSVNSVKQDEDNLETGTQVKQSTFDDNKMAKEQREDKRNRAGTFDTSQDSGLGTPSEYLNLKDVNNNANDFTLTEVAPPTSVSASKYHNAHPASPQSNVLLSEHQRYLQIQQKVQKTQQMNKNSPKLIEPELAIQQSILSQPIPSQPTPLQRTALESTPSQPTSSQPIASQTASSQTIPAKPIESKPIEAKPIELKPIESIESIESINLIEPKAIVVPKEQGSDAFQALQARAIQRTKPEQRPSVANQSLHIGRIDVVVTAEPPIKQSAQRPSRVVDDNWDSKHYLRRV